MNHKMERLSDREVMVMLKGMVADLEMPERSYSSKTNMTRIRNLYNNLDRIRECACSIQDSCNEIFEEEKTRNRNHC
jgi:hypothetical protein